MSIIFFSFNGIFLGNLRDRNAKIFICIFLCCMKSPTISVQYDCTHVHVVVYCMYHTFYVEKSAVMALNINALLALRLLAGPFAISLLQGRRRRRRRSLSRSWHNLDSSQIDLHTQYIIYVAYDHRYLKIPAIVRRPKVMYRVFSFVHLLLLLLDYYFGCGYFI
jgi:hypothetical protein